jgi:hypothetical protein
MGTPAEKLAWQASQRRAQASKKGRYTGVRVGDPVLIVPGDWPLRERYRSAVFMVRARVVTSTAGSSKLAPKRW